MFCLFFPTRGMEGRKRPKILRNTYTAPNAKDGAEDLFSRNLALLHDDIMILKD